MRQMLAATVLLVLLAEPASAAKVTWRGNVCITAISASCVPGDFELGCLSLAFRPPNVGTNGAQTLFAFGTEKWRYTNRLATGTLVGTSYKGVSQNAITTFAFAPPGVTMRFTSQVPATITATTPSVYMAGNINNMDGVTNCNLSFRAAAALAPN